MAEYIEISHPSFDEIHEASLDIAKRVSKAFLVPDVVVGLSRGGLIPATIISHALDLPLIPVSYSSKSGKGDDKHHDNHLPKINITSKNKYVFCDTKPLTILLVDDIIDSAKTVHEVSIHYNENNCSVYIAALYYKELSTPLCKPHFCWRKIPEDSGWIIFPWETKS